MLNEMTNIKDNVDSNKVIKIKKNNKKFLSIRQKINKKLNKNIRKNCKKKT